jgi:hypothetical protein
MNVFIRDRLDGETKSTYGDSGAKNTFCIRNLATTPLIQLRKEQNTAGTSTEGCKWFSLRAISCLRARVVSRGHSCGSIPP